MTGEHSNHPRAARPPVHFWVVGVLLVLWNCWGLLGSIAAQIRLFPEMPEEAIAYLDRQPVWLMVLADLGPLAGVAASLALLMQSRWAPGLFLFQLVPLTLVTAYELATGTSPLLAVPGSWGGIVFVVVLVAAQAYYAHRMARRGLLS